jgi:periplasmic divalent cation tolerance protein
MDSKFVYMTAGSMAEAGRIGRLLVESKLAACVNIIDGMNSIYVWDGQVQNDREVVMIAKTTAGKTAELVEKVKDVHSYDCPCIVCLPVKDGNRAFLDWIAEQVGP